MDQALKCLLNNLKCPICKLQIDTGGPLGYDYVCSNNSSHYVFFVNPNTYTIAAERVSFFDNGSRFTISQNHYWHLPAPIHISEIEIRKVNEENQLDERVKPKIFVYDKRLFDFSQTNYEKILNRIKTILVFQ